MKDCRGDRVDHTPYASKEIKNHLIRRMHLILPERSDSTVNMVPRWIQHVAEFWRLSFCTYFSYSHRLLATYNIVLMSGTSTTAHPEASAVPEATLEPAIARVLPVPVVFQSSADQLFTVLFYFGEWRRGRAWTTWWRIFYTDYRFNIKPTYQTRPNTFAISPSSMRTSGFNPANFQPPSLSPFR